MVPSQHSVLKGAFEWIVVVAIALVATFLIRSFVVEPFVVPTGSMESTIEIGDQILAQKVSLELGQPVSQGDIVVFHNPDGTSEHDVLVKRVIATAGQTVDLEDGKVVVDGRGARRGLHDRHELAAFRPGTRSSGELSLHRARRAACG